MLLPDAQIRPRWGAIFQKWDFFKKKSHFLFEKRSFQPNFIIPVAFFQLTNYNKVSDVTLGGFRYLF